MLGSLFRIYLLLFLLLFSISAFANNEDPNRICEETSKVAESIRQASLLDESNKGYSGLTQAGRIFHVHLTEPGQQALAKEVVFFPDEGDRNIPTFSAVFRATSIPEINEIYYRFESAASGEQPEYRRSKTEDVYEELRRRAPDILEEYGTKFRVDGRPYDFYFSLLPVKMKPSVSKLFHSNIIEAAKLLDPKGGKYLIWIKGHHGGSKDVARATLKALVETHGLTEGPLQQFPVEDGGASVEFKRAKPFWTAIADRLVFSTNLKRFLKENTTPNRDYLKAILWGNSRAGKTVLAAGVKEFWLKNHPNGVVIDVDFQSWWDHSSDILDDLRSTILAKFLHDQKRYRLLHRYKSKALTSSTQAMTDFLTFLSEFSLQEKIPLLFILNDAQRLERRALLFKSSAVLQDSSFDQLWIYTPSAASPRPTSESTLSFFELKPETEKDIALQLKAAMDGKAAISDSAVAKLVQYSNGWPGVVKQMLEALPPKARKITVRHIDEAAKIVL